MPTPLTRSASSRPSAPGIPTRPPPDANRARALRLVSMYRSLIADEVPRRFGVVFALTDRVNGPMLRECGLLTLRTGGREPGKFRATYGDLFGLAPGTKDWKLDGEAIERTLRAAQRLQELAMGFDAKWGARASLLLLDAVPVAFAVEADDEAWAKAVEFARKKGHDIIRGDRVVFEP